MQKLREDEKLEILSLAVENTSEAFVTIDEDQTVLYFNKAAEKLFGYRREEVLFQPLDTILTPDCAKAHREGISNYLETGQFRFTGHPVELIITRKNGMHVPATFSFSTAQCNGQHYFTAIIKDMSEITACHEQVLKSERLAALGQLVAEIVHEIKNPLTLIGGFTSQLKRTVQDKKSQAKINIVLEEVRRLENLLVELRELYLPRNLELGVFDMNDLLKELYLLIKEDCNTKQINLTLETDSQKALVEGDRERLKQVLLNLIKNAVEAMETEGTLDIKSTVHEESIEIVISDNGPGIPKKYQSRIFSPFFTTKKQGTGLGLSISKRILDEHRGSSIKFKSQEGKGTQFTIAMPLFSDTDLRQALPKTPKKT